MLQCDLKFNLLEGVQTSVERLYQDGRPLQHLPSARSREYSPDTSSIFVVDHSTFLQMSGKEIQDIFRDQHILVLGVPTEQKVFNPEALGAMGLLLLPVQGQGEYLCNLLSVNILTLLFSRCEADFG